MIKSPGLADIHAAELKLFAAKQRTADDSRSLWLAVKSTLARPSTLAAVAATGFCGGLLLSRSRKAPEPSGAREPPARGDSFTSVILAIVLRNAMRFLPMMVSRMWAEHHKDEPCTVVKTTVIHDEGGTTRLS